MKTNTVYSTVEVCAVPEKGNVLNDQIVSLPALDKDGEEPILFRRIEYWNPDKQEILVFFTNLLHLAASTVAAIYKERWAVELFFKALKQTAKVKSFLGASANAVKTQIWTALIAMLILKYLQMKSSFGWSLSNLAALLRQQLFIFRDLWARLNNPLVGPPAARQLAEQLPMPLVW
jgi:IS4 transposase